MNDVEAVLDQLLEAGVSVWLDSQGKLRIDKLAPEELKKLVRENRQALIDVQQALGVMNLRDIRIIRLPLGQPALAYHLGTELGEIRWAMQVLRMDSMPLVLNDEGLRWISWEQWKTRRRVWCAAESAVELRHRDSQRPQRLQFGRKTA